MRRTVRRRDTYADRGYVDDRAVATDDATDVRSVAGINFLLGIWLIISPWILNYTSSAAKWNQFAFGIVILVFSAIRYMAPRANWASWIAGLAGIWMIIAPFVLSYTKSAAYWNEVIVGIVVAVLAFANLQAYTTHRSHGSPA